MSKLENLKKMYHCCDDKHVKIAVFIIILHHLPNAKVYMMEDRKKQGGFGYINTFMLTKELLNVDSKETREYQIVSGLIKFAKETRDAIVHNNGSKLYDKFEYSFEDDDGQDKDIVEYIENLFGDYIKIF